MLGAAVGLVGLWIPQVMGPGYGAIDSALADYEIVIPIEFFDIIITDECHRSIYTLWRGVLEYFDAHLIGLTATPSRTVSGARGSGALRTAAPRMDKGTAGCLHLGENYSTGSASKQRFQSRRFP